MILPSPFLRLRSSRAMSGLLSESEESSSSPHLFSSGLGLSSGFFGKVPKNSEGKKYLVGSVSCRREALFGIWEGWVGVIIGSSVVGFAVVKVQNDFVADGVGRGIRVVFLMVWVWLILMIWGRRSWEWVIFGFWRFF